MARFTGDFKQAMLIALWEQAPDSASSLLEAITALLLSNFEMVSGGYNITSTSGAGHSTSFYVPMSGTLTLQNPLTPQGLMEFGGELRRVYQECKTALASSDEALIFEEMLLRFQPVRRMRDDFSGMRIGNGAYA